MPKSRQICFTVLIFVHSFFIQGCHHYTERLETTQSFAATEQEKEKGEEEIDTMSIESSQRLYACKRKLLW